MVKPIQSPTGSENETIVPVKVVTRAQTKQKRESLKTEEHNTESEKTYKSSVRRDNPWKESKIKTRCVEKQRAVEEELSMAKKQLKQQQEDKKGKPLKQ